MIDDAKSRSKRRRNAQTIPANVQSHSEPEWPALDVRLIQAGLLFYLQLNPGAHCRQCARAFGVIEPSMSNMIKELQKNRLVRKQRSPPDDRYVLLTLTRKGIDLVKHIRAQLNHDDLSRQRSVARLL